MANICKELTKVLGQLQKIELELKTYKEPNFTELNLILGRFQIQVLLK